MNLGNILEIAKFRLTEETTQESFLKAVEATNAFLSSLPGYVSRQIVFAEDGDVYDLVEWTSLELAQDAAKQFSGEKHPELVPFMQCLDMNDGFMKHSTITYATG